MTLTTADIEHYGEHGWLAPIDVMSEAEATEILTRLERAELDHAEHLHPEHRNNAHLVFPFLADLCVDRRIVDPVTALLGDDLSLWSTVLFAKDPDSSAFVSWHQDAHYMALEPDHFVTAWLALTPSTIESGCVSVLPGTHRRRHDHADTFGDDNILTRGQTVTDVDPDRAVHLELRPGQMSLHHPWLVHGSQPNRSGARRVGFALQSFLAADVRPLRGDHHVLPVRGAAPDPAFVTVAPPSSELAPDAVEARRAANAALAGVLYDGADSVRGL